MKPKPLALHDDTNPSDVPIYCQNLARGRSAALELLEALDVQVERLLEIEVRELQTLQQALDDALVGLALQRGALAGESDAVHLGDIAEHSEAPNVCTHFEIHVSFLIAVVVVDVLSQRRGA
jgi:hypothetical protein